jgi:hypothetical protein
MSWSKGQVCKLIPLCWKINTTKHCRTEILIVAVPYINHLFLHQQRRIFLPFQQRIFTFCSKTNRRYLPQNLILSIIVGCFTINTLTGCYDFYVGFLIKDVQHWLNNLKTKKLFVPVQFLPWQWLWSGSDLIRL